MINMLRAVMEKVGNMQEKMGTIRNENSKKQKEMLEIIGIRALAGMAQGMNASL